MSSFGTVTTPVKTPKKSKLNVGTPQNVFTSESPPKMIYPKSPQNDVIIDKYINILNNIVEINSLSYKSGFGFIFLITDSNGIKKLLKVYILADLEKMKENEKTGKRQPQILIEEDRFILKKRYIPLNGEEYYTVEADDSRIAGYIKRCESVENFNKEVEIQQNVYEASSSNGPLCPKIYDYCTVDNLKSTGFLQGLLKKCGNDAEAKNMIQYLNDNINGYDIGCILMEYAEGYTILNNNTNEVVYENAIYANIRLLLETGYLHLDLNYGNVMENDENVIIVDFGQAKSINDNIFRNHRVFHDKSVFTYDKRFEHTKNDVFMNDDFFHNKDDLFLTNMKTIITKTELYADDVITIIYYIIKCEKLNLINLDDVNKSDPGLLYTNFISKINSSRESQTDIINSLESYIIKQDIPIHIDFKKIKLNYQMRAVFEIK